MTSPTSSRPTATVPVALDAAALAEWLGSERAPRLLDVRTPAEFETAHIPGSYNVPLDLLREHSDELRRHLDDDVVLVCRSGARASQAEGLLEATRLPNVHVLTGGVAAWEQAGGALSRGGESWELERQVRFAAGSIVLLSVLASLVLPWAIWIAAFIGAGLVVAALTNTCAMGMLLARLPHNRRNSPDIEAVLGELGAPGRS